MQSLHPATVANFREKVKIVSNELKIFIDPDWIDLCDLAGKNYLINASYSKGQEKLTHNPVAARISVTIDDTDGEFHAENPAGLYKTYLKTGRKIQFSTGFEVSGTPKLWQRFEGVISDITRDNLKKEIRITGFDYTQYLTEVRLKRSTNYWGTNVIESTVQDQAKYPMPVACNGTYVAYLDGVPIYEGEHWVYNRADNEFIFLPDHVPGSDGVNDLLIYYFTDQVPENVIADILVIAGLYADRAAVLADMDYTETGIILPRVWFASGDKCLNAIKKICERCNYQFYFKYNNKPVFNPPSTGGEWKDRVFTFTKDLITDPDYKENIDEVRTHIEIEGEKYSPSDLYFKTISGEDILPDSITTEMIQDLAITTPKINLLAVNEAIIAADAVTTTKIADDSISTPKIIAGAIETAKIAVGAVEAGNIAANAVTAIKINAGAVITVKLDALAVTAAKIAAGAIETDKLDALAVTAAKIAANTITVNEINFVPFEIGTHDADNVPASATKKWAGETGADITGGHQAASILNQGDLAILDTIGPTHIDANAVTTPKVNALAITTGKIAAGAIETDKLDALAVTADKIAANTITADEIAANTITVVELSFGAVNLYSDGGLTIDQGALDDDILAFKSSDINHQITAGEDLWGAETDTYAYFRKYSPTLGGLHLNTFCEATGEVAFQVYAVYGAANQVKNSSATGAITLAGLRADPANHTYQACLAQDNIFCIKTKPQGGSYQTVFLVDAEGDVYYDGGIYPFQNEDDIAMLKDVEDILGSRISPWHMKRKDVFKKHKIVHVAEVDEITDTEGKKKTGKKRLDRFISSKKMNMLYMGSIRQLNDKILVLESRIQTLEI